ncbi:MAG: hypothetical protein ACRCVV_22085 [Shewanella sp.]
MSQINFGENVQDNNESVGGWSADDSGVQAVILTAAYITVSKKGSSAVNFATKNKEGDERNHTIYFTNGKGEVFYTDKKTGEARKLPGYQILDNICLATCGKTFMQVYQAKQIKTIDLYDSESRKEIPTQVPTLPAMCKKLVKLGIIKVSENGFKNGKQTNERREKNEIHMVFIAASNLTPKEAASGVTEPKQYNKWVKYWEGRVKDNFKAVEEEEEANVGVNPFATPTDADDMFGDDTPATATTTTSSATTAPEMEEEEDDPFA